MSRLRLVLLAAILAALAGPAGAGAFPTSPDASQWTVQSDANATINAIVPTPTGTFIAGRFAYIGPRTGHALRTAAATGDQRPGWPVFNGYVTSSVADGAGGVFVGGTFTNLGGTGISSLAHINPDGTIDTAFRPAPNGAVLSLSLAAGELYVAGQFTAIGGAARLSLARVSPTTGVADATWNPADHAGVVSVVAASDGTAYVGGYFGTIGGVSNVSIAELSPAGAVAEGWSTNDDVNRLALSVDETVVYATGFFDNIKRQYPITDGSSTARNGVARLFATGQISAWDPAPTGGRIQTVAPAADGSVYVAGYFTSLGSPATARSGLAHIAGSGTATVSAWNPNPSGSLTAAAFQAIGAGDVELGPGGTVFVGGSFTTIGGAARNGAAQLDATTGDATSWNPDLSDPAATFSVFGNGDVLVGGQFAAARGVLRRDVAKLDISGVPTSFDAHLTDAAGQGIAAAVLGPGGGPLWVGGDIASVGATPVSNLAPLDPATGALSGAAPATAGGINRVSALALDATGATLYVGGVFTTLDGQPRKNLGAIATASHTATSFAPDADAGVRALAPGPAGSGLLYVGGEFSTIGSQAVQPTRRGVAALDTSTGAATSFDPVVTGNVSALALAPDAATLYIGLTTLGTIGGQARIGIGAVSTATSLLTGYDPQLDHSSVSALRFSLDGSRLYVGGGIEHVQGQARALIADTDPVTGAPGSFTLPVLAADGGTVHAIAPYAVPGGGDALAVGGDFLLRGEQLSAFVQYRDPDRPLLGVAPRPGPMVIGIAKDTTAPVISRVSLTHTRFRATGSATAIKAAAAKARKKPKPVTKGTQLRFTLSEKATVTIRITHTVRGRKSAKHCVAGRKKGKACTITRTDGTLTRTGAKGAGKVTFSGRIGKHRLAPGRYTMRLVATDGARNASKSHSISFTVLS